MPFHDTPSHEYAGAVYEKLDWEYRWILDSQVLQFVAALVDRLFEGSDINAYVYSV
jgi:hypothetical protein